VSKQRPSERTRGKSSRSPARGITRGSATQPRHGQSSGGLWARIGSFFGAIFSLRHPMVMLTGVVVILTVVAAVLTGGVIGRTVNKTDAAAAAIVSHAGFGVAEVHLSGNTRTRSEDLMAALGVRGGQSIFAVNLRQARLRMLALPWVTDAEITRHYPDDISVRIVERLPYARWQTPVGLVVVERQGQTITGDDAGKFAALPLLLGTGAPEHAPGFVEAVARHRAILKRVKAYEFQSGRRWNLILDGGVVVKLPETGWDGQLKELDRLIVEEGILEHDIREIDLRPPSFFFVMRRDGTEQKEKKTETGSAI
jgi:cell division protein FtsQ